MSGAPAPATTSTLLPGADQTKTDTGTPAGDKPADQTAPGADGKPTDPPANQQTLDDKTGDAGGESGKEGETTAPVVPETYEFQMPEGVTMDAEALGEFTGIAKELGLTQENAQKVADIGAKLSQKWAAAQTEALMTASADWVTAATADKEFGGEQLQENLAIGEKALAAFGTPELRQLLEGSRLGNHPEVIRFMVRAGKAIGEDRMVNGNPGPDQGGTKTNAQRMFPNMNP